MFTQSAHLYDAIYSFKDYRAEAERLDELIRERRPDAATLLDVACGTGRHLEQLARRYAVEGIDLDEGMLVLARAKLPAVPLHAGDMTAFDLGRRFDVVTCLFSSIGYAGTLERVGQAIAAMAAHLAPGGLLLVEPWFSPEEWLPGSPHLLTVDRPELKVARMNVSGRRGRTSTLDFTYLVGTRDGVEVLEEHHEAVLLTDAEYRGAFAAAGLAVARDDDGLMGRGLYLGEAHGT